MSTVMIRGFSVAVAVAAALCLSTAALAQDGGGSPLSVLDRMFGGNRQQQQQQQPQQATGQEPLPDQVVRIERLENMLRQATGQIEQLQYRNQQLEAQIRAMGGTPGGAQTGQAAPMPPQAAPASQMGQPAPSQMGQPAPASQGGQP